MLVHNSVKLLDHQINHVKRIDSSLEREFSYLDTSQTGLGKTVSSLYTAWLHQQKYNKNVKIIVVAPSELSLQNKDGWLFWAKQFGMEIETITYSKLTGRNNKVKHDFLIPNEDKKKWEASKSFLDLCKNGLFLIFDEYHKCKNNSTTHYAAASLVRAAKKYKKVCRVALLSHTPGNKEEHYPQILRMAGIITSPILYKHIPFTSDYNWEDHGFGELYKDCMRRKRNPVARQHIEEAMQKISAARSYRICAKLFSNYIKDKITFAMPIPKTTVKIQMFNAFLESDKQNTDLINKGISMLQQGVAWNGNAVGDKKEWSLSIIIKGLKNIELGKVSSIVKYIKQQHEKFPNKKFVISCGANNTSVHYLLQQELNEIHSSEVINEEIDRLGKTHIGWNKIGKDCRNIIKNMTKQTPDIMNGKVKINDRVKIMSNFQQNTDLSWCLIMSPGVGAESISVHDKWGDHPREMLIVPDYHFGRVIQSAGRINRVGVKSDVKILIVYSKQGELETKILNSMIKKTQTAKKLLAKDQKVLFPGEYPFWIQGEKNIKLETELNNMRMNM